MRITVITVSDRCFQKIRKDESGPAIAAYLNERGICDVKLMLVPDERKQIGDLLCRIADSDEADVIITTGGTGLSPRDVTPEATADAADRFIPGIAEAIRSYSLTITKNAMLSRGIAAQRGRTLIVNLPGSPKACLESMNVIIEALPHAVGIMRGEKLDS